MKAFTLNDVEKRYPGFQLGPLDLELEPGTVLALIGPNGAGKTTLMDLLAGVLRPTRGEIEVFGQGISESASWKTAVGYASEQQAFYENWTARANLRFLAPFFPNWSQARQQALAERFELPSHKKVKALSKGNRAKLSLVAALAHQPKLLLLDEPTAGLDPVVRAEVLEVLWELLEEGESIFYSTHILSDVSRLADELAFIKDGHLLLRSSRDALEHNWRQLTFRLPDRPLPEAALRALVSHRAQGTLHQAVTDDFERATAQLRTLGASQLEANRLSLEEIAVYILKGKAAPVSNASDSSEREPTLHI